MNDVNKNSEGKKAKKKWYKKIKYWVLIILGLFIGICVLAGIASRGMPIFKDVPDETNQIELKLNGSGVDSNANVKIYLNGNAVSEVNADENGKFIFSVSLSEGENILYAEAMHNGKTKKSVEEKIVYINQEKIDAQKKAEEEERARAEEAQNKIDEEAQRKAEEEQKIKKQEAEQKADEEAQRKAEEEANTQSQQAEVLEEAEEVEPVVLNNLGVSYEQMMNYLSNFFTMDKSTPVDGKDRYMGQTSNGLAMLEIIGDKDDIYQSSLMLSIPSDSPDTIIENSAILLRFLKNIVPEWEGSSEWAVNSMEEITGSLSDKKETIQGNKKIEMSIMRDFGMMIVTVKHK